VTTRRTKTGAKDVERKAPAGSKRSRAADTGSGRPLPAKLGLAAGMRGAVLGAPAGYLASLASSGAILGTRLVPELQLIQLFVTRRAELAAALPAALASLADRGALWISWPKRSAGVPSDLTEDLIRELALPLGIVDVKVCAVDAVWSGLKLVRRLRSKV
jgi:hypothetical protein